MTDTCSPLQGACSTCSIELRRGMLPTIMKPGIMDLALLVGPEGVLHGHICICRRDGNVASLLGTALLRQSM
eukprot:1159333-Pelagomonas_calceolata.AAC.3